MRYFAVLLMLLLFISSCGDGEAEYDYSNPNKTEGLEVSPSSPLRLTADNKDGYFRLTYSTEDLFLLGADTSRLTDNFTMEPGAASLSNACLSSAQINGSCSIKVSYNPKSSGNHSGTIVLKFRYVKDKNAEQAKDHNLKVTGSSSATASGTPENSAPAARVIMF